MPKNLPKHWLNFLPQRYGMLVEHRDFFVHSVSHSCMYMFFGRNFSGAPAIIHSALHELT